MRLGRGAGGATGRALPDANPPTKWGRTSATLKGLTSQADKPKGDEPGHNPAVLGNIPEWLVLGPIAYDAEAARKELLAKEFVPNEAAMSPTPGDKAGGVEWQKVPSTGSLLDLNLHYKDMSAKVFYAHAWLHSKDGGRVLLRLMGPTCRFWLNGKDVLSMERRPAPRGQGGGAQEGLEQPAGEGLHHAAEGRLGRSPLQQPAGLGRTSRWSCGAGRTARSTSRRTSCGRRRCRRRRGSASPSRWSWATASSSTPTRRS